MSAKILDGRLVSTSLLERVAKEVKQLRIKPKLVILLVGDNPASLSYIKQKTRAAEHVGIVAELLRLPVSTSTKKLLAIIEKLNKDKKVHGILVQLPLPPKIDAAKIGAAVAPHKDVDGFDVVNLGALFKEDERLAPCTPQGVIRMLDHYKIPTAGKHAVIVGRSNIVGKPLSLMLINRDATVTVCHSKTKNLAAHTRQADIVIMAVGKAKLLKSSMIKKGAVVIDVGINRVGGKLVGDVDFTAVSKKARFITPVPGGVGPMTVACLMRNTLAAAHHIQSK
ncbi:bifunctional methylenetetrahydrofolate dehydrogenase/methenyltetrahydrofolate cyclohydrolase [Candidatus Peregrinibacteria bacterium CG11_big_fil_rev_8_21_14_0_20_46_8]|nr:MAG: bifunctional methylenetetrahydrofolate dehydrogenase/methenyltetrahydrofolate cyclohydrolase [Candidatus Peregrinibacteria bacterium CG11_big_fil_rev_8_21_14_0_20_46_8]